MEGLTYHGDGDTAELYHSGKTTQETHLEDPSGGDLMETREGTSAWESSPQS